MYLKKKLTLIAAVFTTLSLFAKEIPVIHDYGFIKVMPKDKSIKKSATFDIASWSITYDDLEAPDTFLWFAAYFTEPAPYDYKIDVRCWLKFYGWHRRQPPFQFAWYYGLAWDWKYVTFEGYAGDQSIGSCPHVFQSGEEYGSQDELLYFGPK